MSISNLGWTPFFSQTLEQFDAPGLNPARVFRQDKHRFLVHTGSDVVPAILTGSLTSRLAAVGDSVTVGDWVLVTADLNSETQSIHELLPRRSAFKRKSAGAATREQVVAANLDIVFLISGLDGDFNLRRIERYVTQAWSSGATPVILLNKADVCDDVEGRLMAASAVAPGVDVHTVSARNGTGVKEIEEYLRPGVTIALLGSSGVGKSTLLNSLMGEHRMEVGDVREDDSRGRHTTTHREMIILPSGALVIDTPGMRELQLWSSSEDLQRTFAEVSDLAAQCRFNDCSHTTEPGCAVLEALASGELDQDRYDSHLKLEKEVAYLERRKDDSAAFAQRQHERELTRLYRRTIKQKRDRR